METRRFRGRLVLRSVAPDDAGFVAALQEAGLPVEGVDGPQAANFMFAGKDGAPVAYGGYTVLGDIALLRSVAVLPHWRGQRLGSRLVTALISQLQGININTIYLLTEDADLFFAELGFAAIERGEAPQAVRETGYFTHHCSGEAIVMMRVLDEMMRLNLEDIHPKPRPNSG